MVIVFTFSLWSDVVFFLFSLTWKINRCIRYLFSCHRSANKQCVCEDSLVFYDRIYRNLHVNLSRLFLYKHKHTKVYTAYEYVYLCASARAAKPIASFFILWLQFNLHQLFHIATKRIHVKLYYIIIFIFFVRVVLFCGGHMNMNIFAL